MYFFTCNNAIYYWYNYNLHINMLYIPSFRGYYLGTYLNYSLNSGSFFFTLNSVENNIIVKTKYIYNINHSKSNITYKHGLVISFIV